MSLTIPITEAGAFFMKTDPVHLTLNELARRLDEAGIDYAIVAEWLSAITASSGSLRMSTSY